MRWRTDIFRNPHQVAGTVEERYSRAVLNTSASPETHTEAPEGVPSGTPATTILHEDDPEVVQMRYGRNWKDHLMPEANAFEERSGIGDWAPGAENDTPPDGRGPKSKTLRFAISSSYSGHPAPPTPEELYQAFHASKPTERTREIIEMWMNEASSRDLINAWIDHCYTWHELATTCQRHDIKHGLNAPIMNMMAGR